MKYGVKNIQEAAYNGARMLLKGQIISKGLLVPSNSPKKRTNEFVFTTTTNSIVRFLGEFKETKQSFQNYLTFSFLNGFYIKGKLPT